MSKFQSPEKDSQNSTHATGHLGLVEVGFDLTVELNKRIRQGFTGISQADRAFQARTQCDENKN